MSAAAFRSESRSRTFVYTNFRGGSLQWKRRIREFIVLQQYQTNVATLPLPQYLPVLSSARRSAGTR